MSVYVDDAFISHKGETWCHLMADSLDELHQFAAKLGLKREWLHSGDHYDVTSTKRAAAVKLGAIEVKAIQLVEVRRKLRREQREGAR